MKPTFISKEKNHAKFSMEFSAEEFESAIVSAYKATKGQFAIDGFRKGKAPRKLIETHYGEDIFFEEAINHLFSENYPKALDELALDIVDRPDAEFSDLKKGEGFTVTITVEVYPEFEIKDYKGVSINKIETNVADEEVDKELEALQKRNSRMILVDRVAKESDTLLIDYTGSVDGELFEGGAAERYPLKIGSGTFIPGFEEQLIGISTGEEKDITVTFPTEYHSEELAGKEAIFKCKVHEIKEEELPELNDEFAKDVSEYDTLDELKAETKARLEKAANTSAIGQMKNAVLEKVFEASDLEVPKGMIRDEQDAMVKEFDQQLRQQGMSIDKYFEYLKITAADFREQVKEDATKRVKMRMILLKIADQEKIEATDEDLDQELSAIATQYGMELDKIKTMFGSEYIEYIAKDIRIKKTIDMVYESAVIN